MFQELENYFGRKLFVGATMIPYISKLIALLIKYNQHTLPKENKPFKLLQATRILNPLNVKFPLLPPMTTKLKSPFGINVSHPALLNTPFKHFTSTFSVAKFSLLPLLPLLLNPCLENPSVSNKAPSASRECCIAELLLETTDINRLSAERDRVNALLIANASDVDSEEFFVGIGW